MTNFHDDANDGTIESDLTALYAADVPSMRFEMRRAGQVAPAEGRWTRISGHWRPAMAAVGVAAALAVALIAIAFRGDETQSVSAAEVFERASASAQRTAPVEGTLTYHMIATAQMNGVDAAFTTETWYGGEGRFRVEDSAQEGYGFGLVVNGEDAWLYQTLDGVTRVAHGPATALAQHVNRGSIAGQQSLADVLTQYSGPCQAAETKGEENLAGRPVYEIVVTTDPARCTSEVEGIKAASLAGSSLTLWVDQETFLILQTEQRDPDGTVSYRQAVSAFEVSPDTPESIFTYEAPEGVTVVEVVDVGEAKIAISEPVPNAIDGSEGCQPPKDGVPPTANEC